MSLVIKSQGDSGELGQSSGTRCASPRPDGISRTPKESAFPFESMKNTSLFVKITIRYCGGWGVCGSDELQRIS